MYTINKFLNVYHIFRQREKQLFYEKLLVVQYLNELKCYKKILYCKYHTILWKYDDDLDEIEYFLPFRIKFNYRLYNFYN